MLLSVSTKPLICQLLLLLLLHPFNGLFSRTTWVGRHQKGKPFWILLEQEMMGWQWHQLDHMQIICILLQTDNHASISPMFLQAGCPSCRPTNSVKDVTKSAKVPKYYFMTTHYFHLTSQFSNSKYNTIQFTIHCCSQPFTGLMTL